MNIIACPDNVSEVILRAFVNHQIEVDGFFIEFVKCIECYFGIAVSF